MSGKRIDLQPPTSSATPALQEVRFAVRVPGGAKSGFAIVNLLNPPGSGVTLKIYTASDMEFDPGVSGTVPLYWVLAGSATVPTSAGSFYVDLTRVGEYARWALEGGTGTPRLSIVLFLFDA